MNRGRSVRSAAALTLMAIAVLSTACSNIGRPRDDAVEGSSEQTNLAPATTRQDVEAARLCQAAAAVDFVECEVLDLFPAERRSCPEGQPRDETPPCALPGNNHGRRLGWTLTLEPSRGRLRTLTVWSGGDILSAMVRGSDANPPWLTASVCPADVTGDGLMDVVAMFRSTTTPDVLEVEVVNVADAPTRVLTLPPQRFDPDEPQGCRSELLARLSYDPAVRRLQLAPEEDEDSRDRPLTA